MLQAIRRLLARSKCFRPERGWPGGYLTHGTRVPLSRQTQQLAGKPHPPGCARPLELAVRPLRSGKRAAVIMSLLQSAKLNGHDPYRYLAEVLERLPTQPASQLDELLPHHWQPRRCPPATSPGLKYSTPSRCDGRTLTVNAASLRLSPLCPQTMSTLRGLRLASRQNASFSKRRKRSGGRTLSWRTAFAPTRG